MTQTTVVNVNARTDGEEIEDAQKSTAMWLVRGNAVYVLVRTDALTIYYPNTYAGAHTSSKPTHTHTTHTTHA